MLCVAVLIVFVRKHLDLNFCEKLCLDGGMQELFTTCAKIKNNMFLCKKKNALPLLLIPPVLRMPTGLCF